MRKGLTAFIWRFVRPQRWVFALILFLSLVWSLETTLWPYFFGRIIDTLTLYDADRASVWPAVRWILFAGFGLWTVVETCFRLRNFLHAKAFPKLEADIRMAMFDHVQHHSPRYFNE